jgi:hypothetical protein
MTGEGSHLCRRRACQTVGTSAFHCFDTRVLSADSGSASDSAIAATRNDQIAQPASSEAPNHDQ